MENRRVLLVDDEPSLRLTLAANLELEGFEVLEAAGAEGALELLSRQPVDVVLSDVRMPGLNGAELFRHIKALRPGTPVVFMTAFADEDLVRTAVGQGVFAVLPKPCEVPRLVQTVAEAVRRPMVLVVDDIPAVADILVKGLRHSGVRAEAVTEGRQALQLVRAGNVDLCTVDLVMPEMSGPDLVDELHRLDPTVAIIAVSGHSVPEMYQRVAAAGVFACMRKPFPVDDLVQAIASARGRLRAPRAGS